MKHMKRTLAILLTLVLLCTGVPFAFAEDATIVDSGTCGDNLTWTLDSEGTLRIRGTGDMTSSPWKSTYSTQIKKVVIEDGVINIADRAFEYCSNIINVVIGDSVTSIGKFAFNKCRSILQIDIGDGVISIGDSAFEYCTALERIKIGKHLSDLGKEAFICCFSLKSFFVDPNNQYFSCDDGCLYNKDQTVLIQYPLGKTDKKYVVPETVKEIGNEAFALSFITEVVFPSGLSKVGDLAFLDSFLLEHYTVKGMNTLFDMQAIEAAEARFKNIPEEIIKDVIMTAVGAVEPTETTQLYLQDENYFESGSDWFYLGTIRCHAGSTAEAYAIEHNMNYELTHFFEGDWTYDWDNLVRWRKCIHCDERETEPLETETPGGAEIVGPADGDTSFDVEPVSTDYVLIKETLGEMNVIKAFDISLKNQDGVHVQPSGTVKVKLPGDIKAGDYKVYRVNADGTYTDMNAFLQGSHLVFYTDHFSLYVVVDESAPAEPDTLETPDTPAKESKVRFILRTVFEFLQKLIRIIFGK